MCTALQPDQSSLEYGVGLVANHQIHVVDGQISILHVQKHLLFKAQRWDSTATIRKCKSRYREESLATNRSSNEISGVYVVGHFFSLARAEMLQNPLNNIVRRNVNLHYIGSTYQ